MARRRFVSSFDAAVEAVRIVLDPSAMMYELNFRGTPPETIGVLLRLMPYLIAGHGGITRDHIHKLTRVSRYRFDKMWDDLWGFLQEPQPDRFVLAESDWFTVRRVSSGRSPLRHLLGVLVDFWGDACVYCGAENVDLEIEHIVPVSRGGNDALTNLTLACQPCNIRKYTKTAAEFGFPDIHERAMGLR